MASKLDKQLDAAFKAALDEMSDAQKKFTLNWIVSMTKGSDQVDGDEDEEEGEEEETKVKGKNKKKSAKDDDEEEDEEGEEDDEEGEEEEDEEDEEEKPSKKKAVKKKSSKDDDDEEEEEEEDDEEEEEDDEEGDDEGDDDEDEEEEEKPKKTAKKKSSKDDDDDDDSDGETADYKSMNEKQLKALATERGLDLKSVKKAANAKKALTALLNTYDENKETLGKKKFDKLAKLAEQNNVKGWKARGKASEETKKATLIEALLKAGVTG